MLASAIFVNKCLCVQDERVCRLCVCAHAYRLGESYNHSHCNRAFVQNISVAYMSFHYFKGHTSNMYLVFLCLHEEAVFA